MKIILEKLIEDREAGTLGPWVWNDEEGYYTLSPGIFISDSPDGTPWGDNIDRANARRIARLPDLEEAYIEAIGLLKRIDESPRDGFVWLDLFDFLERNA